jgi:beta-glucanase (GH16 family)
VDGAPYYTLTRQPSWNFAQWPFNDKPFHIKINIAIGGSWGGVEGIDDAIFPVTMEIDFVCVYQSAAVGRMTGVPRFQ